MIAKVYSAIPCGYDGQIVTVEGDSNNGLPSFNIVGMANKTITEARERVRSAIANSDLYFPAKKVTINLAPAELAKDGAHLDLPIALSILLLSQQLLQADLDGKLFAGELSLDGTTKPIRGVINIVETAKSHRFSEVYVPIANLSQARLVPNIKVIGVSNLTEILLHLKGIKTIHHQPITPVHVKNTPTDSPILDDIIGQNIAKRALTIAIAGHHNLLLSGPPGVGKSLLAQAAANLLPPMSPEERITVTKLHSLCNSLEDIITKRPFRAPHHTASPSAIVGGGRHAIPGEISLAHHGVLFLDEMPEYPRNVLEALRQPLEDRKITISRTHTHVTYPADFMLIATMNPCPCGYLNDPIKPCTCTPQQIQNYKKRLSGPILDRIDMTVNVEKINTADLLSTDNTVKNTKTDSTAHSLAKLQINRALQAQRSRYNRTNFYNSNLSSRDTSVYVKITKTAHQLLQQATVKLDLSARAYFKLLKIARTIADLDSSTEVKVEHISEAISFRQQLY